MAEKKQVTKVVDPMVAFIDIEGDPEAEIEKREAELKAKGEAGPTKGSTDIGLKEGPGGEQDLPEQTPESPEVEAEARDEGPEEEEIENPEGLEATESEPAEKPQVKPWQRVKEMRKELKEERKAREALEAKLAQIEARQQAQDQQRYEYSGQGQRQVEESKQQQTTQQVPVYQDDPLGNHDTRIAYTEARQQALEQEILMQRVVQRVGAEEIAYERQAPDYVQARDWAVQREWESAKAMGLDDRSATMQLLAKRQVLIASAWQNGKSVGQAVYEYARAMGYPGVQQARENGNGHDKTQEDAAQERVRQATAREKQASASLGSVPNTPGKTGGNRLTRARVMSMTQEEMDKLSDNDPDWMERVEM